MKFNNTLALVLLLWFIVVCTFVAGFNCGINSLDEGKPPAVEVETPKSLEVIATAYCPCVKCCGKDDGITATGTKATAGRTIAVDPSIFPYGTEITINGHTYIAEDCGGAVKGNRVDIFFNTHQEARNFGVQAVTAYYY